jgi:hypothetical protein
MFELQELVLYSSFSAPWLAGSAGCSEPSVASHHGMHSWVSAQRNKHAVADNMQYSRTGRIRGSCSSCWLTHHQAMAMAMVRWHAYWGDGKLQAPTATTTCPDEQRCTEYRHSDGALPGLLIS